MRNMHAEFEAEYGETEGVCFIQELNVYGGGNSMSNQAADLKSNAWYHWQRAYHIGYRAGFRAASGEVEQ